MNKKIFVFIWAVLLAGFLFSTASAELPREINFQGRLLDGDGQPVTEEVNITFGIYDALTGGDFLNDPGQTATIQPNDEGFYTTTIYFSEIDNLNRELYISVEVDDDGEMDPRLKILPTVSALYSLRAATASFVEGEISTAAYAHVAEYSLYSSTADYAFKAATATFLLGEVSTAAYAHEAGYALTSDTATYALHAATASFLLGEISTATYSFYSATAAYTQRSATAAYAYDSAFLEGRSYQTFLSTSGGQLGGSIDMNSFHLINVSSITSPTGTIYLSPRVAFGTGEDAEKIEYDEETSSIRTSTNVVVTGDLSIYDESQEKTLRFVVNIDTTSAPSAPGILGTDSKWNIYISTGDQPGEWSKLNNP